MSVAWIISHFFREKCDENAETHKLCKNIAAKYMECEKRELRAQSAREENLSLKLDIGNLESLCSTVIANHEAQANLHSLLREYYEEHLKVAFDIDECEIEKLHSYEEIKIELETRDSVGVYQQFYWRKIKMATKMEERRIVKNYRQKEQELLKTQDERLRLEGSIKKLKEKAEEARARRREVHERIYRLVKGSKDLEIMYSRQKPNKYSSQNLRRVNKGQPSGVVDKTKSSNKFLHKAGLSSRLLLDFNQFQTPFVPILSKIHTINPALGLSRLLQQAEVLRKSIQRNVISLSNDPPVPKPQGILKNSTEFTKLAENSYKTVSFETETGQEISVSNNILDTTSSIPQITLDTTVSEINVDSELKKNLFDNTKVESKKAKIEILENIIIKPANTTLPPQLPVQLSVHPVKGENPKLPIDSNINKKRKILDEDHSCGTTSPTKKNRCDTDQLDNPIESESKSFLDMFLDFSTSTGSSFTTEDKKKAIQNIEMKSEKKESIKKIEENIKIDANVLVEGNKDDKKKPKKAKASFDDFEDFFSGLAGKGKGSDCNDNDHSGAEMSFDFFEGNENTDQGDAESDNFSFKF